MDPEIRYTTASDGVTIAYHVAGEGRPVIGMSPGLYQSIDAALRSSSGGMVDRATSRNFKSIRFDPRGCGLSDRDVGDFSLESMARDIDAVADAVDAASFALVAAGPSGLVALAYAATRPERVTHLVLINCNSVADWPEPLQRLTALSTLDWRLVTETLSRVIFAWENDEAGAESAAMMRSAVTPETYARYQEESRAWNVRPFLRAVRAPTLFLHARDHVNFPSEPVRRLASDIAGSRVVLLDVGDTQPLTPKALAIIGQFLGMTAPQPARRELVDGTAVIMFTDIVDSAALTERMGDGPFRAAARSLDERMRTAIAAAGGHTIEGKLLGDGVLAVFRSARAAIDAARTCVELTSGGKLTLHVGLHAGDVQREGENVFGGAVNIAARVCALSEPGEILVSATVRDLARTSAGVTFVSRGERTLKGIADPVSIYAVESAG